MNFSVYIKKKFKIGKKLKKEVVQGSPFLVIARLERRSPYPHASHHENQK